MIDTMSSNLRSFRVDDDLWLAAQRIARGRDESLSSDVLRPALERYVSRYAEKQASFWIAMFEHPGMPRTGSGPVVTVKEENGGPPLILTDPRDQNGVTLHGVWIYDGRDEKNRIAIYTRPPQ